MTQFGVLGKLLTRLRTLPEMDQDMVGSLNELVLSSTVDIEDTVVLCCTKERARTCSLAELDDMDGEEVQNYGVDRKGALPYEGPCGNWPQVITVLTCSRHQRLQKCVCTQRP